MLFNSFEFAVFLPIVFLLYWFVLNRKLKLQNLLVLIVSYLFYGWWDWRFLLLIAFTSGASYLSGVLIEKYRDKHTAKIIAASNIVLNLLILCIFKYFNFFTDNIAKLFGAFGYELDWVTLDILLPVGISFYTFQALSYTIDVYKKKIIPTHDIVSFFAYVSFFPQLVAGPIERATNLLPQFYQKRIFNYLDAISGLRQILWGLFKKIVIADNCAIFVNSVFSDYTNFNGSTLFLGGVMFAFQIYGDFSGYSDIAIGTAKLFGIKLTKNFHFPYLSRDIAEFWRRWHISLNTWFRDYIYIPLGGSKEGKYKAIRNTFIIFLVSGLWHGANWTFVSWGAYHAILFVPLMLLDRNRKNTNIIAQTTVIPNLREFCGVVLTFILVVIGWIIFRADNITLAVDYLTKMCNSSLLTMPELLNKRDLLFISILVIWEYIARKNEFALEVMPKNLFIRWSIYILLVWLIFAFGAQQGAFIYFQF